MFYIAKKKAYESAETKKWVQCEKSSWGSQSIADEFYVLIVVLDFLSKILIIQKKGW